MLKAQPEITQETKLQGVFHQQVSRFSRSSGRVSCYCLEVLGTVCLGSILIRKD